MRTEMTVFKHKKEKKLMAKLKLNLEEKGSILNNQFNIMASILIKI